MQQNSGPPGPRRALSFGRARRSGAPSPRSAEPGRDGTGRDGTGPAGPWPLACAGRQAGSNASSDVLGSPRAPVAAARADLRRPRRPQEASAARGRPRGEAGGRPLLRQPACCAAGRREGGRRGGGERTRAGRGPDPWRQRGLARAGSMGLRAGAALRCPLARRLGAESRVVKTAAGRRRSG